MMALVARRFAPYVFALFLSCFMTFVVSGIATLVAVGPTSDMPWLWMRSWITAWIIAFPALLVIRPYVHRLTEWLTS